MLEDKQETILWCRGGNGEHLAASHFGTLCLGLISLFENRANWFSFKRAYMSLLLLHASISSCTALDHGVLHSLVTASSGVDIVTSSPSPFNRVSEGSR